MSIKNILFAILLTAIIHAVPGRAAPVCVLGMVPCFLDCHNPPALGNAQEAATRLNSRPYDKLNSLDRWAALVTTPLGKCLGVNGWRRYGFQVWATGTVENAATSWDGLRTVDVRIDQFSGDTPQSLPRCPCFIRAEVVRRVWKHLQHLPSRGDRVRIEGELHWDGHGFLEIHPANRDDVQYLNP